MKKVLHPLNEEEVTAWIFIILLMALILVFGYLFWQRVSVELPQSLGPAPQVHAVIL